MTQNGRPWQPPFQPLSLQDLVGQLHEADWPESVILNPIDFASVAQGGVPVHRNAETGETCFYFGTTKIICQPARKHTLDLSSRPNRIVTPLG